MGTPRAVIAIGPRGGKIVRYTGKPTQSGTMEAEYFRQPGAAQAPGGPQLAPPDEAAGAPAAQPAGTGGAKRDPRLPPPGTEMWAVHKGTQWNLIEDEKGAFHVIPPDDISEKFGEDVAMRALTPFPTVSAAARFIVGLTIKPGATPTTNGYAFWTVAGSDEPMYVRSKPTGEGHADVSEMKTRDPRLPPPLTVLERPYDAKGTGEHERWMFMEQEPEKGKAYGRVLFWSPDRPGKVFSARSFNQAMMRIAGTEVDIYKHFGFTDPVQSAGGNSVSGWFAFMAKDQSGPPKKWEHTHEAPEGYKSTHAKENRAAAKRLAKLTDTYAAAKAAAAKESAPKEGGSAPAPFPAGSPGDD